MEDDYRGHHRAPTADDAADGTAAPLWALEPVMPDVYRRPRLYSHGPAWDAAARVAQAAEGKPDRLVTIYRAAPAGISVINAGDWVTTSLEYARIHACQDDEPANDWPVLMARVPAAALYSEGDLCEYGYCGPGLDGLEYAGA